MKFKTALIALGLILSTSCATNSTFSKIHRPEYRIPSPKDTPSKNTAAAECHDLGSLDGVSIFFCIKMFDQMNMNLELLRIISTYESIDIWDDNLKWKERPANKFLADPSSNLL